MAGLRSPGYTTGLHETSILVIDKDGNPLVGAHLKWPGGGVVTNQSGEAHVIVPSTETVITISYMGKRNHIAKFKDLVNAMITMQDQVNNLPPVVVGQPRQVKKKEINWMMVGAIGIGAILILAALSKKSKGLRAPVVIDI